MKAFVVLALIGSALAAPAEDIQELERAKKSAYEAPCGGGPIAPVALYLSAAPQGQHYREDDHTEEQERSYYGGAGLAPSAGASAVGVFPNARVGNCAVPLLLSCAPNVVQGHLSAHGGAYGSAAYRTQEFEDHKERKEAGNWSEKEALEEQQKAADLKEASASPHHIISDLHSHHGHHGFPTHHQHHGLPMLHHNLHHGHGQIVHL